MNFYHFFETDGLFTNSFKPETMKEAAGLFHFNSVIIIDNDDTDLFITSRMFMIKNISKEIYTQKNIESAIELIKKMETPPDLIIIDCILKDGKLLEFLSTFTNLPETHTKDCKIIILSSLLNYYEDEIKEALKFKSVTKAISKPLSENSLQDIVNLKPIFNLVL